MGQSSYEAGKRKREKRYSEKLCIICGFDNERYPMRTCEKCSKKQAKYYKNKKDTFKDKMIVCPLCKGEGKIKKIYKNI